MCERKRKLVLVSILVLLIVGLITAKLLGKQQDKVYKENNDKYNQLISTYSSGEYQNATLIGNQLLTKVPDSEFVNYLTGISALNNQDYYSATILLQKSLDLNPHKVEDPIFMINFAEALYYVDRLADAEIVLLRCQERGWLPENYPEYQTRVNELLQTIKQSNYGG